MREKKVDNYDNVKIKPFALYKDFFPGKWIRCIIIYKSRNYMKFFPGIFSRKTYKIDQLKKIRKKNVRSKINRKNKTRV